MPEFPKNPQSLDRLIRLMAGLLGGTVASQEGPEAIAKVEQARQLARDYRRAGDEALARQLADLVASLSDDDLGLLVKAFTHYFGMANLAERIYAAEQGESGAEALASALSKLRQAGLSAAQLGDFFSRALVMPVFTAHPTESRRRSTLKNLHRLTRQAAGLLEDPERPQSPQEREALRRATLEEIVTLWQSDDVRRERPSVLIESRRNLFYFEESLYEAIPQVYRGLEEALASSYGPGSVGRPAALLRFGTWIGGDRDGNPFVTAEVTGEVIGEMREAALGLHRKALADLSERLSLSLTQTRISLALAASLKEDGRIFPDIEEQMDAELSAEPYRRKCFFMAEKLRRTVLRTRQFKGERPGKKVEVFEGTWYTSRHALLADLELMDQSLRQNKAEAVADGALSDLRRRVEVFGLQLARMDLRQDSGRHLSALAEILQAAGACPDARALSEAERLELYERELASARPLLIPGHAYEPATREVLETLVLARRVLEDLDPEAFHAYIVSMTHAASDMLGLLLLMKECGLYAPGKYSRFDLAPLFETRADLEKGAQIMGRLYDSPAYSDHLRLREGRQEVMLGYSDSNKEIGYVASRWHLYRAQVELTRQAKQRSLSLTLFHGRGGSVGRGGGPAHRAILAQPPHSVDGRLRITEQGEVVSDQYLEPGWALGHLSQLVSATLLASHSGQEAQPEPAWEAALAELAERAQKAYRSLVYEEPGFVDFFRHVTPIHEISRHRIGSRPASRQGGDKVENLRAIPWVFAWTQARFVLAAWYGLGSALDSFLSERPDALATLRDMYARWPFFRDLLDNAQMTLKKADMATAKRYLTLAEDQPQAARLFEAVRSEHVRSRDAVCRICGVAELLQGEPELKASLEQRNRYLDPLGALQIELLKRLRALPSGQRTEQSLEESVLLCINGIAAGMKNTG